MTEHFDSRRFVSEVADDLLRRFGRASSATTPGLKGAAREVEVRNKLQTLLPRGVGVGTGCVIDHQGNVSAQQDIILFEKNLCPAFSVNDAPESTYYPCEGVIAVGEVKTAMGKSELEDSFRKIESVKALRRLAIESGSLLNQGTAVNFRKYLSSQAFDCTREEMFDQSRNSIDQIYGFVFCGEFSIRSETFCTHLVAQVERTDPTHAPNIIASLRDGIIVPYDEASNSLKRSLHEGTGYVQGDTNSGAFEYLLAKLHQIVRQGRTVEVNTFERYIIADPDTMSVQPQSFISCGK